MIENKTIEKFSKLNIDVNAAFDQLRKIPISIHCWQFDDVTGFEDSGPLSGGIQATGNYPGKARNFMEMTSDMEMAFRFIPGAKKINLHAIYKTSIENVDRKDIGPEHFEGWVDWAKKLKIGLDYNPTIFSSPWIKNNLSLSSPDEEVRKYWIQHCINSRKVAEYFGRELGQKSLCNIWIPDGLKDIPADRKGPRELLKKSLDEIMSVNVDDSVTDTSVESKLFGIGVESYTSGSHEFYWSYALLKNMTLLLDTGHFHLTENVADKVASYLNFSDKLAMHISRPVRWDSDHVLRLNDELIDIANELVRCKATKKTYIGLDYFDASINRVAAVIIGTRNMQKALLHALLTPWDKLKQLQDEGRFTELLALQEAIKTLPINDAWEEYCKQENVGDDFSWFNEIEKYEQEVLSKRG